MLHLVRERNDGGGYTYTDKSVSFVYGTILSHRTITYSPKEVRGSKNQETHPNDKVVDTYDVFKVRGDDNGQKLFEFMAGIIGQKGMEAAHFKCGIEGDKGLNFVSTAHYYPSPTKASEPSLGYLFNGQLRFGYTIREIIHSHPFTKQASQNDNSFSEKVKSGCEKLGIDSPIFKIYHNGDYIIY